MQLKLPATALSLGSITGGAEHVTLAAGSLGSIIQPGKPLRRGDHAGKRCTGTRPDKTRCTTRLSRYNRDPEGRCFSCQPPMSRGNSVGETDVGEDEEDEEE